MLQPHVHVSTSSIWRSGLHTLFRSILPGAAFLVLFFGFQLSEAHAKPEPLDPSFELSSSDIETPLTLPEPKFRLKEPAPQSTWHRPTQQWLAQAMATQPPTGKTTGKKKTTGGDTITGFTSILNVTASYNLLGLRIIATAGYKWRLYASNSRAFRDNYFSLHAVSRLTPAWIEFGAVASLQPASFIKIRTAYRFRFQLPTFFSGGVFSNMDFVRQQFENIRDHRDGEQVLRDQIQRGQDNNNGSRVLPLSHIFSVDLTLRFAIRGFLVLANIRYSRWWSSHGQTNLYSVFYEGGHDMIFNNTEHFLMVEGATGYEWKMLRFLVMLSYRQSFEADDLYFRLGPAVMWLIAKKWGAFKKPSLLLAVNWYVFHRWRGRDFVPLIAVRFGGEF